MVQRLCESIEDNLIGVDHHGMKHYTFPSVSQLSQLSEQTLLGLGWGYRSHRLCALSTQLLALGGEAWLDTLPANRDEEAVRGSLCQLSGVGRKVADCAMLPNLHPDPNPNHKPLTLNLT